MLLILIYLNFYGIFGIQLNDLLILIGLYCVKIYLGFLKSLFYFQKYFVEFKLFVKKFYYCKFCLIFVFDFVKIFVYGFCLCDIIKENLKGYFIEILVIEKLKNLFNFEGFVDVIKYRFF